MFVDAIETAGQYTRPICTISRNYGSTTPVPGAATLFLVNAGGWALTCRHVAQVIIAAGQVNAQYEAFKAERAAISPGRGFRHQLELLELKFGYSRANLIQVSNNFVDCVDGFTDFTVHFHPNFDVALIKFNNFKELFCETFPMFAADGSRLKQGKSICRLGFPFPEFQNYEYDANTDSIGWNADPRGATPRFPIDGMVTRHLLDPQGVIFGFELSTPGLRGQSGGPAFDVEARVWGMQSATNHLDLDFDVDVEVLRSGGMKRVRNSPFLHVGHCIHVEILKDFMRANGVGFREG